MKSLKEPAESESIPLPPQIVIEIFIDGIEDDSLKALFEGNGNSTRQKACGVQFKIALNETHLPYYEELVKCGDVQSIPIEYYDFSWSSFARDERVTPTTIPIKSAQRLRAFELSETGISKSSQITFSSYFLVNPVNIECSEL